MQLEFKKQNGLYEVEFEVTGNFNLHLERKNYGRIELYQKTSSETNYTSSPSYSANGDAVINLDFSMGIYPKFVKIISYTEVEKAIVTMEGESGGSGAGGAKIVPYTKDITIKDNTTEEFITLYIDEDGYYNYGTERPGFYIDVIITDAKVFIGEINMVGYNNSSDSIEGINIVPSYVDKSTNISIAADSRDMGGGSPVIKFKLMEIV